MDPCLLHREQVTLQCRGLFQNFPQFIVIHTVKSFDIVNKEEIDVFLELFAFSMIQQMLLDREDPPEK